MSGIVWVVVVVAVVLIGDEVTGRFDRWLLERRTERHLRRIWKRRAERRLREN